MCMLLYAIYTNGINLVTAITYLPTQDRGRCHNRFADAG